MQDESKLPWLLPNPIFSAPGPVHPDKSNLNVLPPDKTCQSVLPIVF
jgi:hypothetical protein